MPFVCIIVNTLRICSNVSSAQGCCPGTHKPAGNEKLENMPGVSGRHWATQWVDSPWTTKHPNWDPSVPVHYISARAGDCILFTEKLKHGTIPWTGKNERRTLFFKYVPFVRYVVLALYPLYNVVS